MKIPRIVPRYETAAAMAFLVGLSIYILACVISPLSWSPDGKWIALTRYATQDKEGEMGGDITGSEMWVVSPSPIARRRVMATSGSLLSAPAWSRDGKALFAVEFVEIEEEEGAKVPRTITRTTTGNGKTTVVEEKPSTDSIALWMVPLDGKPTRVWQERYEGDAGGALTTVPAPSPDGKRIAFLIGESGVGVVGRDGQLERTLEIEDAVQVLWSPDGKWLTVISGGGDDDPSRVRLYDLKASETIALDGRYHAVSWLPDGQHLLAVKQEGEGGNQRFSVAQLQIKDRAREIGSRAIDIEGAGPQMLLAERNSLLLLREGKDDEFQGIVELDLRDGKTKVLYESIATAMPSALSPDGRRLAFRQGGPTPGQDVAMETVVGVLDLAAATTEPLYLAVDDKQWAVVLEAYLEEFEDAKPEEIEPDARPAAEFVLRRLDTLLASFRRDFPQSPLLPKYEKAIKEIRAKLRKVGIGVAPGAGRIAW